MRQGKRSKKTEIEYAVEKEKIFKGLPGGVRATRKNWGLRGGVPGALGVLSHFWEAGP